MFIKDDRYLDLTSRLNDLNKYELSTLNRYYYHKNDQRCCKDCKLVFGPIKDNFHIKKYDGKYVLYNSSCKECLNKCNRNRIAEKRKNYAEFIASRFTGYKHRALTNNIPFNIDVEYLVNLYKLQDSKCYYTNEYMSFEYVTESGKCPHLNTPSIDRKDPKLGYVKGNIVWASYKINRMKNELNTNDFYKMCELVLEIKNAKIL